MPEGLVPVGVTHGPGSASPLVSTAVLPSLGPVSSPAPARCRRRRCRRCRHSPPVAPPVRPSVLLPHPARCAAASSVTAISASELDFMAESPRCKDARVHSAELILMWVSQLETTAQDRARGHRRLGERLTVGLLVGVGGDERRQRGAGRFDTQQRREGAQIDAESPRGVELRDQVDVGERDRVPEQERAGGLRGGASSAASPRGTKWRHQAPASPDSSCLTRSWSTGSAAAGCRRSPSPPAGGLARAAAARRAGAAAPGSARRGTPGSPWTARGRIGEPPARFRRARAAAPASADSARVNEAACCSPPAGPGAIRFTACRS